MNALSKKQKKRRYIGSLMDELQEYAEMYDCNSLLELHEVRGFGRQRLHDHLLGVAKRHIDNEHKYCNADDHETLGTRCDVLAMKRRLKEIGFDYDKECELILAESLAYEREKYGGVGIGKPK